MLQSLSCIFTALAWAYELSGDADNVGVVAFPFRLRLAPTASRALANPDALVRFVSLVDCTCLDTKRKSNDSSAGHPATAVSDRVRKALARRLRREFRYALSPPRYSLPSTPLTSHTIRSPSDLNFSHSNPCVSMRCLFMYFEVSIYLVQSI